MLHFGRVGDDGAFLYCCEVPRKPEQFFLLLMKAISRSEPFLPHTLTSVPRKIWISRARVVLLSWRAEDVITGGRPIEVVQSLTIPMGERSVKLGEMETTIQ